jgi:hypothetical protein
MMSVITDDDMIQSGFRLVAVDDTKYLWRKSKKENRFIIEVDSRKMYARYELVLKDAHPFKNVILADINRFIRNSVRFDDQLSFSVYRRKKGHIICGSASISSNSSVLLLPSITTVVYGFDVTERTVKKMSEPLRDPPRKNGLFASKLIWKEWGISRWISVDLDCTETNTWMMMMMMMMN